jgi:hypothetical protein
MAFSGHYSKFSKNALGGAAIVIASGVPISVGSINVANNTGAGIVVDITTAEAAPVTIWTIAVPANSTIEVINEPYLADKGLRLGTGAATTHVTVLYRDGV